MIARFFAKLIAGISEELLQDLLRTIMREILVARKKADMAAAMRELETVMKELNEEMTNDEKNQKLIDAGRAVVKRVRR